jgi:hypothetical protein
MSDIVINKINKTETYLMETALAYERATKAEDYDNRGYTSQAIEMWLKIFGDYFPAYG